MFKLSSETGAEFAISEKTALNKVLYSPGISFFSEDGVKWTDLYDYRGEVEKEGGHYYSSQVACIKAFTIVNKTNTIIIPLNHTIFSHNTFNNHLS